MLLVDYYLSLASPYAYMGHARFIALTKKLNTKVIIKPVNMGEILSKTGGLPVGKRSPERQAYRLQELERWHKYLDIPLNLKPKFFPVNDIPAAKVVITCELDSGNGVSLAGAYLRAVWAEEKNIADPVIIVAIANKLGLDGEQLLNQSTSNEVTKFFECNTQDALDVGVFGAPTYVFGEQLFWGQDRIEFLCNTLKFNA
jgi:2-hydroxychromene-2-carboxylate isomerase